MNTTGWTGIQPYLGGKITFHYVEDIGLKRQKSLCGKVRLYVLHDTISRHITEPGNCRTCARLLKKKEAA